ncbi:MAG: hypothetical protein KQH63_20995 [Desulfobulbaceae bacterium]|nr:hypothetical protein [Desulfobulbaceae bacterium]
MDNKKQYKRKMLNLNVNRAIQVGMINRITCILFGCLLLSSAVYYFLANQEITASFMAFNTKAQNFLDFLLPAIIGSFAVSLLFGIAASLFVPKNYAGSLYGIERDLKKITKGDLNTRIRLRRGDPTLALGDMINKLVDAFKDKLSTISNDLAKAEAVFASSALTAEEQIREVRKIHAELLSQMNKLEMGEEEGNFRDWTEQAVEKCSERSGDKEK